MLLLVKLSLSIIIAVITYGVITAIKRKLGILNEKAMKSFSNIVNIVSKIKIKG